MAIHHGHSGVFGRAHPRELLDLVSRLLGSEEPVLKRIREAIPRQGLPAINVGPDEGRVLAFLSRACRPKRAVEIGTLAGYSACWIAKGLAPGGILHTIEFDPRHAAVARLNFKRAGLSSKVRVHEGRALDVLSRLVKEGPFDFCFIDADKASYDRYLSWACRHLRPGGLAVADNAYLFGKLHLEPARAGEDGPGVKAMQRTLKMLGDKKLFSSCAMIPTGEGLAVGIKK